MKRIQMEVTGEGKREKEWGRKVREMESKNEGGQRTHNREQTFRPHRIFADF